MNINFDLEDFVAYLLNGGLMVAALSMLTGTTLEKLMADVDVPAGDTSSLFLIVVSVALILIAGHVSSVFSRYVTRRTIWWLVGSPRERPFSYANESIFGDERSLWNNELSVRLREALAVLQTFSNEQDLIRAAPRLIRSYVLERSERLRERRNRLVQARSICANAVLPMLLFALHFLRSDQPAMVLLTLVTVVILLCKQHDLDRREWKEIYVGFLVLKHDDATLPSPSEPVSTS